jgi:hypothetical protein
MKINTSTTVCFQSAGYSWAKVGAKSSQVVKEELA